MEDNINDNINEEKTELEVGAKGGNIGVESEDETAIVNPFDPEEISLDTKPVPMDRFIRNYKQGKINLAPSFQRSYVWGPEQQSKLIESLILKIPLPMFYVSSDDKDNWDVVDGLQRLTTIRNFILGKDFEVIEKSMPPYKTGSFSLKNLEYFPQYNNKYFKELPEHIQNKILDSEFYFTIIKNGTPEEVKFNIFKRINTGGMPLSSQEIRNALYQGKAINLLNTLSQLPSFKSATGAAIDGSRMLDKEMVLRLIAFLITDIKDIPKSNFSLEMLLNHIMFVLNNLEKLDELESQKEKKFKDIKAKSICIRSFDKIESLFDLAMTRSFKMFNKHSFRKSLLNPSYSRAPVNKAFFDSIGVVFARLDDTQFENLIAKKDNFIKNLRYTIYGNIDKANNMEMYFGRNASRLSSFEERFKIINEAIRMTLEGK